MIYKSSDGTRVRTRRMGDAAGTVEFETYRFTPLKKTLSVTYLDGQEAEDYIRTLSVLDGIRFGQEYGARPATIARKTA